MCVSAYFAIYGCMFDCISLVYVAFCVGFKLDYRNAEAMNHMRSELGNLEVTGLF